MGLRERFCSLGTAAAVAAWLFSPALASAADTFVDQGLPGNDANNCTQPTNGGAGAGPCLTIGAAIAKAGGGDTIHVADPAAPTTYNETPLTLGGAKNLVASSPDNSETLITSGGATPTITVAGGRVQGFTIRGTFAPLQIDGPATVAGNRFDQSTAPTGNFGASVAVNLMAGSPTLTGNVFKDPTPLPTENAYGIISLSTGSPTITGNTFTDMFTAISVGSMSGGATPSVSANDISGTHDGTQRGVGIFVDQGADATVTANFVHSPGAGAPDGIFIFQGSASPTTAADLHRNRVIGHDHGIEAQGNLGAVTLHGDLIAHAISAGLVATENGGNGGGDLSATNLTVMDTILAPDIQVGNGATLTLNSSIIGTAGDPPGGTVGIDQIGNGDCVISFSRGDGDNVNGCNAGFVSTAAPMFVNPALNDYHLQAGSPMIDAGDPANPGGELDLDGNLFGLSGTPACSPSAGRRDIGADEFVPAAGVGCPSPIVTTPPPASPKKCKKGRKLKRGKCVRKKKKK
jgi:hypothetical protein